MKFADLPVHPSLAAALAARGYETATGVQAAILDPRCAGRDLLISSQTGSGKTVAFGVAIAGSLLGPDEERVPHGPKPIALVVAPTRELATQVREELRWLFQSTRLRLASFTGGTPVMKDVEALRRGVELVIGTPGRLVDLIRRKSLDLSALRVVTLDEADEMLDLGFREDLEALLQAAPAERRTLMLSATMPPEIRALARSYQRDALAVDPRQTGEDGREAGAGRSAGAAHDDITHRAHLIAPGDRLAAVVNLLRTEPSARAIVFCTTREGVSEMHDALRARGFAATYISGERAQGERDRALEDLRRGDALVLVATNVAARGLHLPDVDLIVHADLPLNADSLIHRSGRTGRAGRKGTAVLLATAGERRKAERLLATAHVKTPWTAPPSAETIAAAALTRLAEELAPAPAPVEPSEPEAKSEAESEAESKPEAAAEAKPASKSKAKAKAKAEAAAKLAAAGSAEDAERLLALVEGKISSRELLQRLIARELTRMPTGEPLRAVALPNDRSPGYAAEGPSEPRRSHGEFSDAVVFRINMGAQQNADPRWMLPLICRRGGVTRREVGAIRVGPRETTFEIVSEAASDFAVAAAVPDPRALHVVISRVDGPPSSRPAHRPHAPHKPFGGGAPAHRAPAPHKPFGGGAPAHRAPTSYKPTGAGSPAHRAPAPYKPKPASGGHHPPPRAHAPHKPAGGGHHPPKRRPHSDGR